VFGKNTRHQANKLNCVQEVHKWDINIRCTKYINNDTSSVIATRGSCTSWQTHSEANVELQMDKVGYIFT
jgi:hypothetical protein